MGSSREELSPAPPLRSTWACPLCGGESRRALHVAGYWIRQCQACDHQHAELAVDDRHVENVYGDAYFTGAGGGYRDYLADERLLVARGGWYARKMQRYRAPGSVLDVGAAAGFTLSGFAAAGWLPQGVEPNAAMAARARQRLEIPVDASSFEAWTPPRAFDLVCMFQVLPHFADPKQALIKARAALVDGGHLLLETWDRKSMAARLMGEQWHEYSPPSVLHWFSKKGLIRLAADVGFTIRAQGRPSKWISAGHAKKVLRAKAATSTLSRLMLIATSWAPDRLAMPYPADDLFWLLLERR